VGDYLEIKCIGLENSTIGNRSCLTSSDGLLGRVLFFHIFLLLQLFLDYQFLVESQNVVEL